MLIIVAIGVLALLIIVHELGHFLAAKIIGVPVEAFSIGLGPAVFEKKMGETTYRVGIIPFGGFVKLLGEEKIPEELEVNEELMRKTFVRRSYLEKIFVVLSGPIANIFFAWLILVIVHISGFPLLSPEIGEVIKGSPAETAGLKKGDVILKVDGHEVSTWDRLASYIHKRANKTIELEVSRSGEIVKIKITPREEVTKNIFGETKRIGVIGIKPSGNIVKVKYPLLKAIEEGTAKTINMIAITIKGIIKIIERIVPLESIGGPIMIVQMAKQQANAGGTQLALFIAIVSVNLAVLNLLPIPVLDGGHILVYTIEAVIRRSLSERARELINYIGLSIILLIMIIAMYNDLSRLVLK